MTLNHGTITQYAELRKVNVASTLCTRSNIQPMNIEKITLEFRKVDQ